MRLASLEWLPYAGNRLVHQGWSSFIAEKAASRAGFQTEIDYFPWKRAMRLGVVDPQYAGYFPAYYTNERARECHFSSPIGSSTIGLAHLKNIPLAWNRLEDLSGLQIGVVAGFSNGRAFDAMVREGSLQVDPSPSDLLNLRKLVAQRVDAVVIDRLVLRYLLSSEAEFEKNRAQIAFHAKPLAELALHVCFQRSPRGLAMQRAFDTAMQALPLRKLETEYFRLLERSLAKPPK